MSVLKERAIINSQRCVILAMTLFSAGSLALEDSAATTQSSEPMEEVVVLGRFLNAAQQLLNERRESDSVVDVLDGESISRLGDSTVANAMRRMTGVSLVSDKFVYVRGLGERYSSTTLNGAYIPSPDLTRNVIPLDIFPSAVVSGLSVQKTFSPDIRANFAGGSIDVRTTAFPDQGANFSIELGSGFNAASRGNLIAYPEGGDDDLGKDDGTRALPIGLLQAAEQYRGNFSAATILNGLAASGQADASFAEAQAINAALGTLLNRDVDIESTGDKPDQNIRMSGGANWLPTDDLELGFQLSGGYESSWRQRARKTYNFAEPEERFSTESRTTQSVRLNSILNVGMAYGRDHEVSAAYLFIRDTDNEAAVEDFFNENRTKSDGIGFSRSSVEFEQRELSLIQLVGEHTLGDDTRSAIPVLDYLPSELVVTWQYTESEASTDIPNAVRFNADTVTDPVSATVLSRTIQRDSSAADFRFTELEDDALSYGYKAVLPIESEKLMIELAFGYQFDRKARQYAQREFGLGSANVSIDGGFGEVFSNDNLLNPDNEFELRIQGAGSRSYLAATMTTSYFGMADIWLDQTYRVSAGIRREDYAQVAVPWNLFGYSVQLPMVTTDSAALARASFEDSKLFPSLTLGYFGAWWADEFQARVGWSQTVIRPDLREVSETSYVDPLTDELTFGNPDVVPSDIDNFDLRFDFLWDNGNNFTFGVFHKEIDNPIEFYELPASDTNRARGIINAESSTMTGLELEGLIGLGGLGALGSSFFIQGNATLQDSETVAGRRADAPTNQVRAAAGASDVLVNLMLGFDSSDGAHTASLIYNVFGERLYRAGRLGSPDEFEQPFHSLDLTYGWFPTERLSVKFKAQNLLAETSTITASDVTVYERKPGTSVSFKVKYDL